MLKHFLLLSACISIYASTYAQVSGVKTIPGDYANLAAAVADLNAVGVGAGGATLNVAAGHTETLSAPLVLTLAPSPSSAARPLVIQKSGTGANPLITAQTGTSTSLDAIFTLNGADYVTVNGIDLQENVANTDATMQMEWGYTLLKESATNGCQYNSIKNCTVTMNKANTSSRAIYVANHLISSVSALTLTVFEGTNSYNKFYSNTLQNTYSGITINGFSSASSPFHLYDQGNEVGTEGNGRNQILNFGGAATNTIAIGVASQNNFKAFKTYINGGAGSTGSVTGISSGTSTNANIDIYSDTITLASSANGGNFIGIANGAGATGAGNTVNIYNNLITNCTNTVAAGGLIFRGINSSATASYTNIYGNVVSNNTVAGTGEFSCIHYSGNSSTIFMEVAIHGNVIRDNAKTGTAGALNMISANATTTLTKCYNNQCYNNSATASNGPMYGYFNFGTGFKEHIYNNQFYNNAAGGEG